MASTPFDWEDKLFSDVRVVFVRNETAPQDGASSSSAKKRKRDAPREELSFLAHRFLLANCSPVLKTMLLRAEEEQRHGGAGGAPKRKKVDLRGASSSPTELNISIEDTEQLAAEVLLRYLYSGDFSKEIEQALGKTCGSQQQPASLVHLLVLVYRLADRLEVKACLEACAKAIVALKSDDLESTEDINFICSLQASAPMLCDKHPINGLLIMCSEVLVRKLPDAHELCDLTVYLNGSSEEVQLFLRLNFYSFLAWISSDLLKAVSETDVLAMACYWVKHNEPTSSQLALLSHRVRLKHLTRSYLANLKVIAPWFAATPAELAQVSSLQGTTVDVREAGWKGPPLWFGKTRPESLPDVTLLVWNSKKQVLELFEAARGQDLGGWASEAMKLTVLSEYWKGYHFDAALDLQKLADGSGFDLVFVLRARHAVVETWDSQGGDEHGDEDDEEEEGTDKEGTDEEAEEVTVEGASAAEHEAEVETRISDLLSVPVCVQVKALDNSSIVKAEKSILLPLQEEWLLVGSLAKGLRDASELWSFLDAQEYLNVDFEISGLC